MYRLDNNNTVEWASILCQIIHYRISDVSLHNFLIVEENTLITYEWDKKRLYNHHGKTKYSQRKNKKSDGTNKGRKEGVKNKK